VCTLTRSETTAVADAFTAAHPELAPDPILGAEPRLTLWPHELNANGMFIAAWRLR
jgi:16S rRNA (cytosine967-C5)-methyltransferase